MHQSGGLADKPLDLESSHATKWIEMKIIAGIGKKILMILDIIVKCIYL